MIRFRFLLLCALATGLGCEGKLDGPPRCDDDAAAALAPGRSPVRRLTVREYDNTVRDLLGDTTAPAARLVDPERNVANADARVISSLLTEQYVLAAEDVAARATTNLDRFLACERAIQGDDACAGSMIDRLGSRLFRRPLTADDRASLLGVYTDLKRELSFAEAVRATLETMLQAPQFLYRLELTPGVDGGAVVRLDGWQLATRLSFLLWATTPNDDLIAAAAAGELDTDAGVEAHARRMLADARAEPAIQEFFADWLELGRIDGAAKDPAVFPAFTARIPPLMRTQTEAFVREVLRTDGSWRTLMTASWTMANDELAAYYGIAGPGSTAFARVELDPAYHAGLLTHGSLLAARDRPYESSPIHRGMFVRAGLICGAVPDVPEGLDVTPPDPDPTKTTRDRLAEHRINTVCSACHNQMDPLGLALEHFDGAGRFRTTENGLPIDATGEIVATDVDGPVDGAVDLAGRLVDSTDAQACFVKHWFRHAHARGEQEADRCEVQAIAAQFRDHDFNIHELIVDLTLSDAFLYRVAAEETAP